MDAPVPRELFNFIDIFSPNESELGRLTGMPTDSFEQISQAVLKCHEMVSVDAQIFALSLFILIIIIVVVVVGFEAICGTTIISRPHYECVQIYIEILRRRPKMLT